MTLLVALSGAARAAEWEDPATLTGLIGSYAGLPGAKILYVTLGGTDGYRASGPFTRFVVTGKYNTVTVQSGRYDAIGTNPAVGAIISFFDAQGNYTDSWSIIAIQRDPTGQKITALELSSMTPGGPMVQLFRVGL
jgi:hypothetical protein